jgi:hypothetical protein
MVALKGMEAARKYTHGFGTEGDITVMCNML